MEKSLKSSPFSLNNFSLSSSHNVFNETSSVFGENIFAESKNIESITEAVMEEVKKGIKNQKRLNDLDGNILGNVAKIEEKRLNLKEKLNNFTTNKKLEFRTIKNLKGFILFLFPPISKSKTIKDSVKELKRLNKNTKSLISTKIPFGENQARYKELSDNIALACNIQTKLKKKIG